MIKIKNLLVFLGKESIFWLSAGVISSFILSFIEVALGGVLQLILAKLGTSSSFEFPTFLSFVKDLDLGILCIFLVVIGIVRGLLQIITSQSGNLFDLIISTRLKALTMYDLLLAPRQLVLPASEINFRFTEIFPKTGSFVATTTAGGLAFIQVAILGVALFTLNSKLAFFGMAALAVAGLSMILMRKTVYKHSHKLLVENSAIAKAMERLTRNWVFVKISRTQNEEYTSLLRRLRHYFNSAKNMGMAIKFCGVFPTVSGVALIASMIYFGHTYAGFKGAELLAFSYLFHRFVQQLSGVVDTMSNGTAYYLHFKKAYDIFFDVPKEERSRALSLLSGHQGQTNDHGGSVSVRHAPKIEIRNLTYSWSKQPLFNGLNFEIPSGSLFGIVGQSGSGKSTLLSLILGVLTGQEGGVLINGEDCQKYFEKNSQKVGYVGPDPFLAEGSLKDNIIYGMAKDKEITDQDIARALTMAQLSEFSHRLDYPITENGEGLSSGQKQRLAIARALLKDPELLILDEATSNLDQQNEAQITEILEGIKKQCTVVVVTHRPGPLKVCDQVLNLELMPVS